METVYLDELFCLDLIMDYFLLLATARLCALPYRRGRYLAAAALGAAWSAAGLLPGMGWLLTPAARLLPAGFMTLAAFGGQRRLGRCFAAFLGASALFGGTVYAAGLLRGGSGPMLRLDMRVLILAFAVCYAAVSLLCHGAARAARPRVLTVTVERAGRTVTLRALEDTGNSLVDPITGRAAFVAEAKALAGLFPAAERRWLKEEAAEAALHLPGARLIPYAGVEGRSGLLLAFLPDRVTVDGRERDGLLAAVSPGAIGAGESYDAIL